MAFGLIAAVAFVLGTRGLGPWSSVDVAAGAAASPAAEQAGLVSAAGAPGDTGTPGAAGASAAPGAAPARTPEPTPRPAPTATPVPTAPPLVTLTGYRWPLPHGRLTLPFGQTPWGSRIVDGEKFHDGIDLATFCGDHVVAAHDGMVLAAGRHYDGVMGWIGDLQPYLDSPR